MPTLARLSFWVSPERTDVFEAAYKKKLVPILTKHDLVESSERGRSTAEGMFSRLIEVETPSEMAVKERALRNDPAWQEALRRLGMAFGTTQPDGLLRIRFGLDARSVQDLALLPRTLSARWDKGEDTSPSGGVWRAGGVHLHGCSRLQGRRI